MDEDEFMENGSGGEDATDEEEEDEEPKIKFDRIGNDLPNILEKDAVSCVAVHSKFICVGSHRGQIYVLDPLGNNIILEPASSKVILDHLGNKVAAPLRKSIDAHKIAVNQMSIDYNGEYIASCSDDGNVNIFSLCDGEQVLNLNLERKIRSIAIDPQYSRGGLSRRFILGDDNVTLYERNIFSRLKPTILLEGNTYSVSDIKWSDRFVAWSWNTEVRIYDMIDMITISRVHFDNLLIQRNNDDKQVPTAAPVNPHRCNLFWKDTYAILIGWGNIVQLCAVKKQVDTLKIENGASSYFVQIISLFTTDFWICGLSSFGQYLTVLCLDKIDNELLDYSCTSDNNILNNSPNSSSNGTIKSVRGERPKLHIIKADRLSYDLVYTHVLQTRGFQEYKPIDYHFASLTDELLYFIATPKDIILAKSRDMDDHIEWLIAHEKYEEALECTSQNSKHLERHTILEVGTAYLDHLIDSKKFDEGGKLCLQILGKENWMKWEEQVLKFAQLGQLRAIAPYLPRNENNRLNSYIYEMVLFDYLKNDQEAFLCLVRDWAPPPELYNVTAIIGAVIDHLLVCQPDNRFLLQSLADLYSYQRKYGKALAMYLKLQDPQVFHLIQRYGLFEEIKENVEDLMALNSVDSLVLFMKHRDSIEPALIVQKLQNNRYYLYQYLDALYKVEGKEMRPEFHGLIVSLYADYGPDKLLQFLKSSDNYPMQEAMRICTLRRLYPEMIYLLGRMGNTKEALRLITHELEDMNQAIEFCKEHDDQDLWSDLINFSMDKPSYINLLLCNIGTHVDPQILVRRIENGMEIPGLRDSLVKIMQDYNLQVSLQEGCKNILVGDCLVLFEKLVKTQLHGVLVEDFQKCGTCHKKVVVKDYKSVDDVKVFFCKHVFHDSCLSSLDHQNCTICNLPRKGICLLEKL